MVSDLGSKLLQTKGKIKPKAGLAHQILPNEFDLFAVKSKKSKQNKVVVSPVSSFLENFVCHHAAILFMKLHLNTQLQVLQLQPKSGPKPRPALSHFRPQILDKSSPIVTWDKSGLITSLALKCFGQVRPRNAGTSPASKCQDKYGRETSLALKCQDKSGLEVLGQVRSRDKSSLKVLGQVRPRSLRTSPALRQVRP